MHAEYVSKTLGRTLIYLTAKRQYDAVTRFPAFDRSVFDVPYRIAEIANQARWRVAPQNAKIPVRNIKNEQCACSRGKRDENDQYDYGEEDVHRDFVAPT